MTTRNTTQTATSRSRSHNTGADNDGLLADLIDQYLQGIESGVPVDIDALVAVQPELAEDFKKCIEGLELIQRVNPRVGAANSGNESPIVPMAPDSRLGDYRLICEIGRGGMGVVYEAEQVSLSRRVALKVLPFAALLQRQRLDRFKNEARAAATLDHPNIVSVHGVGCESGIHYIAMQYVEGVSLEKFVGKQQCVTSTATHGLQADHSLTRAPNHECGTSAETVQLATAETVEYGSPESPLPGYANRSSEEYFRTTARLARQIAEALDHAHSRGVVHRDVKPSNVLVDNDGRPMLVDFGLARLESDAGMTISGDIVGTLRYMSPEQARGKQEFVDHRTDIYSLGASLYELLTQQPLFEGNDRNELLLQIAEVEPLPPSAIETRIPVDLETIVLTAMEKQPADRYPTARALADDLDRFLNHQPILAKRPTFADRCKKWSRRHPVLVRTTATCIIVLALALAGWLGGQIAVQKALADELDQGLKEAATALADDKTEVARIVLAAAERAARTGKAAQPLRQRIVDLIDELDRYEEFSVLYNKARMRRASSEEELKTVYDALMIFGLPEDDSVRTRLQAKGLPNAYIDRVSEQLFELLVLLAHDRLLWMPEMSLSDDEKLHIITKARDLLERAFELHSPSRGYYWVLANCSQRMGDLTEGPVRKHHDTEALRLRALADKTPPNSATEMFCIVQDRRWGCADENERVPFRRPIGDEDVLTAYRDMLRLEPANYNALFFTALKLERRGRHAEALQAWNACLALRSDDDGALHNRALALVELGFSEEGLADHRKVIENSRTRLIQSPESNLRKHFLAASLRKYGKSLGICQKTEEARDAFEEAIGIFRALSSDQRFGDRFDRKTEEVEEMLSRLNEDHMAPTD